MSAAFPTPERRRAPDAARFHQAMASRVRGALYSVGVSDPAPWLAEHAGVARRAAERLLDGRVVSLHTMVRALDVVAERTGLSPAWLMSGRQ